MGNRSSGMLAGEGVEDYDVSLDDVFSILGNERRRLVLGYLKARDDSRADVGELATSIAAWEHGKPTNEISYDERKSVRTSLHQLHLPKMDELGFVEFDTQRGTVVLTDLGANLEVSVGVDDGTPAAPAALVVFVVATVFSGLLFQFGALSSRGSEPVLAFGVVVCLGAGASLSVAYERWVAPNRRAGGLPVPEN